MTDRPRPRHPLLARQLRRSQVDEALPSSLLELVNEAYRQADDDRALLERSLELTSAELRERAGRLQAFFDSAPFRMGVIERIGDALLLVSHNAQAAQRFGPARRPPIPLSAVVSSSEHQLWLRACDRARGEPPSRFELTEPGAQDPRVLAATIGAIADWPGHDAYCYVVEDLTERRRMLDQMIRSERLAVLGTLTAGVGHELRNALSHGRLHLECVEELVRDVQRGEAAPSELPAALGLVRRSLDVIARIADDMRVMGRDDPTRRDHVDLGGVLGSVVTWVAAEAQRVARVSLDVPPLPTVRGDEAWLGQVFLNLVRNAVHAIGPGRPADHEIRVVASVEGTRVTVDVTDTGPGIPDELVARIFEPFFSTKPTSSGSGLGLSISSDLVARMGGELQLSRTQVGRGTTFRVTLPVSASALPPPPGAHRTRSHVLFVDENAGLGDAAARFLARDHAVTVATSSTAAIDACARGEQIDWLVLDADLRDGGSADVLEHWLSSQPALATHVVVTSAIVGPPPSPIVRRLGSLPPARCLHKPFALATLRAALDERSVAPGEVRGPASR